MTDAVPLPIMMVNQNSMGIGNMMMNQMRSTPKEKSIEVNIELMFEIAKARWLNVSELAFLLDLETTPLTINTSPPPNPPPSGSLFLYDRSVTRNYKDDRYLWVKKRNSQKVREDHVKLRINGKFRVAGCYVHCITTPTLHRRAYHLLNPETGNPLHSCGGFQNRQQTQNKNAFQCRNGDENHFIETVKSPNLVLVHYLDTRIAAIHASKLATERSLLNFLPDPYNNSSENKSKTGRKSSITSNSSNGSRSKKQSAPLSKTTSFNAELESLSPASTNNANNNNTSSSAGHNPYDDEALDILWSMVMEEGTQEDIMAMLDHGDVDVEVGAMLESHAGFEAMLEMGNGDKQHKHQPQSSHTSKSQSPKTDFHLTGTNVSTMPPQAQNQARNVQTQAQSQQNNHQPQQQQPYNNMSIPSTSTMPNQDQFGVSYSNMHQIQDMNNANSFYMQQQPKIGTQRVQDQQQWFMQEQQQQQQQQQIQTNPTMNYTSNLDNFQSNNSNNISQINYQNGLGMWNQHNQYHQHMTINSTASYPNAQHNQQQYQFMHINHSETQRQASPASQSYVQQSQNNFSPSLGNNSQISNNGAYAPSSSSNAVNNNMNSSAFTPLGQASYSPVTAASNASTSTNNQSQNNQYQSYHHQVPFPQPQQVPPIPMQVQGKKHHPQRTPLPEIVDFTPESIKLEKPTCSRKVKVALSCSSPLPPVPTQSKQSTWHRLAVFLNLKILQDNKLSLEFINVFNLTSLNPYSLFCSIEPSLIRTAGIRSVFLVDVKLYKGVDPICEGIVKFVKEALEKIWKESSGNRNEQGKVVFYRPADNESLSIRVITQLSVEKFRFEEASEPTPMITTEPHLLHSITSSHQDESQHTSSLPAPPAAMAYVASALTDFPGPEIASTTAPNPTTPTTSGTEEKSRKRTASKSFSFTSSGNIRDDRDEGDNDSGQKSSQNKAMKKTMSFSSDAAHEWAMSPAFTQEDCDETKAEQVDRHCKLRFAEKLSNLVESNADEQTPAEVNPGACADNKLNHSNEVSQAMTHKIRESLSGFSIDDAHLMEDDEQLDSLLDGLLIRIVETLIEMSASDSELREELNQPDQSGFCLLHYASLYNLQSLIPILLYHGVNPDTPTVRAKLTPLHLACGAGNFAIVELLVRNGTAIVVEDSFGLTPADHAERNGFSDIARWLREKSGIDGSKRIVNLQPHKLEVGDLDNAKHLLQTAFASLSLKDKLTLNMLAKKVRASNKKNRLDRGRPKSEDEYDMRRNSSSYGDTLSDPGGMNIHRSESDQMISSFDEDGDISNNVNNTGASKNQSTETKSNIVNNTDRDAADNRYNDEKSNFSDEVDVTSVISDSDRENLDLAMKLMNREELDDLEKNADTDVRKWMLRRSYESLKETSLYLQSSLQQSKKTDSNQQVCNHKGDYLNAASGVGTVGESKETDDKKVIPSVIRVQFPADGTVKFDEKNLNKVTVKDPRRSLNEALAGLVIRKNMLNKKKSI